MACEETGIPEETLITAAGQSEEISNDRQRVKKRSLKDLIALDDHIARKSAKCSGGWGSVGIQQMIPPSAPGE